MLLRPPYLFKSTLFLRENISNLSKMLANQMSTIDVKEIDMFKNYTEEWWNENGKLKSLHTMNAIRIPFIRDGLANSGKINADVLEGPKPLKDLNILDVGCGGGILSEALARLGASVTGIDACKELIECATLHAQKDKEIADNINYQYTTVEDYCNEENIEKYDAVVASEILEHVHSPKLFLESCSQLLKPKGSIFVTTENRTWLSWFGAIVMAEYVFGFLPKGTHDWNKFIPPHELRKILEDYNCRTVCIHGMTVNVLTGTWYWFPDDSINYALHAVKIE